MRRPPRRHGGGGRRRGDRVDCPGSERTANCTGGPNGPGSRHWSWLGDRCGAERKQVARDMTMPQKPREARFGCLGTQVAQEAR
eukprot:2967402-Pleurochrysis_carterae.AAC.1